jgi:hypothetical protein
MFAKPWWAALGGTVSNRGGGERRNNNYSRSQSSRTQPMRNIPNHSAFKTGYTNSFNNQNANHAAMQRQYRATQPPPQASFQPQGRVAQSAAPAAPVQIHNHHYYGSSKAVTPPLSPDSLTGSPNSQTKQRSPEKVCTPTPLCPTVVRPKPIYKFADIFGRLEPRPSSVTVLGRNYTAAASTRPGRETELKNLSPWPTIIYFPINCRFMYVPIFLFFCSTAFPKVENGSGVAGILKYQWLLNRKCGNGGEIVQSSDEEVSDCDSDCLFDQPSACEQLQSSIQISDIDAPSFFIIDETTNSNAYTCGKPNGAARIRVSNITLEPIIKVTDSDQCGALLSVEFRLKYVDPPCDQCILWQAQIGESSNLITTHTNLLEECECH